MRVRAKRKRYSTRRPRAVRREQVLDAALEIVDESGFGELSVEAVARRADVAKTVVYDAVGNRDALLRALLKRERDRAIADIAAALPTPPFEDPESLLADGIERVLDAVREHPATWRLILVPPEGTPPAFRAQADRHREQLREQLEPIVAWGLGEFGAEDLDPELATHALLGTVETAIRITLADPDRFTTDRFTAFGRALVRRVTGPPG
jgi:AcrR family transcriptional regulator